jgi:hypothetical protein
VDDEDGEIAAALIRQASRPTFSREGEKDAALDFAKRCILTFLANEAFTTTR